MAEPDESRLWKYLEIPQVFQMKAGEIDITHKQHLRICEKLAKHLSQQKPKTPREFEQVEYMKNFVVKSADLSEKTIGLLDYLKTNLQEMYNDYKAFHEGATLNARLRDQSEKILLTMKERDEAQNELNQLKRELRRQDKATA